jgi:hypothetical protein
MYNAIGHLAKLFANANASPDTQFAVIAHGSTQDSTHPYINFSDSPSVYKFLTSLHPTAEHADVLHAPYQQILALADSLAWNPNHNKHLIVIGNSTPTPSFNYSLNTPLHVHAIHTTPTVISQDVAAFLRSIANGRFLECPMYMHLPELLT